MDIRNDYGRTPLYYAAKCSYYRCVKLLLEAGADASIADFHGYIPLHVVYRSCICAVTLIFAYPAGVHAVDQNGRTPLHIAVEFGTLRICSLLLNTGSIIDATDTRGCTPLYYAILRKRDALVELLLDHGARSQNGLKNLFLAGTPARKYPRLQPH